MKDQIHLKTADPVPTVELVSQLSTADMNDLCDATDAAIEGGGGFGWLELPSREILERYWQGVIAMPARILFVARLDGVICGTCQLIQPPLNNQAQAHIVHLTTNFVAPWARGHGLATMLLEHAENTALEKGYKVINLDVRETMDKAIKLYETLGYVRFGEHPCSVVVDGKPLTSIYYYKIVDPAFEK